MFRNPLRRPISASLSPNAMPDDVLLAARELLAPWRWFSGNDKERLERELKTHFSGRDVFTVSSGRGALTLLLRAMGIGAGDHVIVQAFTCMVVPNAVHAAGAETVFCDIDRTLNLDPADLKKKITPKTRAIIVQHTFGVPADMDSIMDIAKRHNIAVIEDLAHAIGATYGSKPLGTIGDAAFLSFGRDKALSSVSGGALVVAGSLSGKIRKTVQQLDKPGMGWVFQQVVHPVAFAVILPLYRVGIGKMLMRALQSARILGKPVTRPELAGHADNPKQYPQALARLMRRQLAKSGHFVTRRRTVAGMYRKELGKAVTAIPETTGASYLRFPLFAENRDDLVGRAKRQGILLGTWFGNVIDPKGSSLEAAGYRRGSCPSAEKAASRIINLPTLVSEEEAAEVTAFLKNNA